jgi:hypothetical protein
MPILGKRAPPMQVRPFYARRWPNGFSGGACGSIARVGVNSASLRPLCYTGGHSSACRRVAPSFSRSNDRRCHPRSSGSQCLSAGSQRRVTAQDQFSLAHADQLVYDDHAGVASLRQVDGMAGTRGRFHRNTRGLKDRGCDIVSVGSAKSPGRRHCTEELGSMQIMDASTDMFSAVTCSDYLCRGVMCKYWSGELVYPVWQNGGKEGTIFFGSSPRAFEMRMLQSWRSITRNFQREACR